MAGCNLTPSSLSLDAQVDLVLRVFDREACAQDKQRLKETKIDLKLWPKSLKDALSCQNKGIIRFFSPCLTSQLSTKLKLARAYSILFEKFKDSPQTRQSILENVFKTLEENPDRELAQALVPLLFQGLDANETLEEGLSFTLQTMDWLREFGPARIPGLIDQLIENLNTPEICTGSGSNRECVTATRKSQALTLLEYAGSEGWRRLEEKIQNGAKGFPLLEAYAVLMQNHPDALKARLPNALPILLEAVAADRYSPAHAILRNYGPQTADYLWAHPHLLDSPPLLEFFLSVGGEKALSWDRERLVALLADKLFLPKTGAKGASTERREAPRSLESFFAVGKDALLRALLDLWKKPATSEQTKAALAFTVRNTARLWREAPAQKAELLPLVQDGKRSKNLELREQSEHAERLLARQ